MTTGSQKGAGGESGSDRHPRIGELAGDRLQPERCKCARRSVRIRALPRISPFENDDHAVGGAPALKNQLPRRRGSAGCHVRGQPLHAPRFREDGELAECPPNPRSMGRLQLVSHTLPRY